MDRRQFIASTGVGLALFVCGCSTSSEFEPDVDPVERLGAAPQVSMEVTAEKDFTETEERPFEEWATRRATERASEGLRELLGEASLTGQGVSIGFGVVDLEELDHPAHEEPPEESEFNRATSSGPIVSHEQLYSRDGDLRWKPDVEFREIVEATPRSFEVSMRYPARTYVAILPVMCQRRVIQET